jgi:hypothetical protein
MALFTDPVVLDDGVDAARSFEFGGQVKDAVASKASEWIETAADAQSESKIMIKHMEANSGQKRHLVQTAELYDTDTDADGNTKLAPIILNTTVSHDPRALEADIQLQYTLHLDALSQTGVLAGLIRKRI